MRVIYLIAMGFLSFAVVVFVCVLIGFGVFSYKEKEEKAAHAFFWSENLGKIRPPEEIEVDLIDKFPVGSDVEGVVSLMRENKAKCAQDVVLPPDKNNPKSRTAKYCSYTPGIFILTTKKTLVAIYHNDNKIERIGVTQKSVEIF